MFFGSDKLYPPKKDGRRATILDKHKRAVELIRRTTFIVLTLGASTVVFIIYPLYLFVMKGELPKTMPIILPYTDPKTNWGYYINLANQTIIASVGILGNFAIEVGISIMTNNLWAHSDIIKYELNEIVVGIKRGESKNVRRAKLRNIFVQIQDVDMQWCAGSV